MRRPAATQTASESVVVGTSKDTGAKSQAKVRVNVYQHLATIAATLMVPYELAAGSGRFVGDSWEIRGRFVGDSWAGSRCHGGPTCCARMSFAS